MILAAGQTDSPGAQTELGNLLQRYWRPLYYYACRRGLSHHDAQDIVQGFFLSLLERRSVVRLDPLRGRFRSFLLGALQNYMANVRAHGQAAKRGGGIELVTLNDNAVSESLPPAPDLSPEEEFERAWALAVVEAATRRARATYESRNRAALFDALQSCVSGDDAAPRYKNLANELNITVDAVKTEVVRMRREFRGALRKEVAIGLMDPREIDDELRYLRRTLAAAADA